MNDTAVDALLANNNNKTTDSNNTQQRDGVAHGGRTTRPEVTTDANNTQQRGGVAHGGHDGAAVEGATTAELGKMRPDVFNLTGNTQDVEESHIKRRPAIRTSIRSHISVPSCLTMVLGGVWTLFHSWLLQMRRTEGVPAENKI